MLKEVENSMLRITLKNFEKNLESSEILRYTSSLYFNKYFLKKKLP